MRAQAVAGPLAALTLLGCGRSAGPALPPEVSVCAPYAASADTLGYCIVKQAGNLPSPMDVARICPLAGALEGECRRSWMMSRADPGYGFGTDTLLELCADEECRFELLDTRPEPDVARQLQRCRASAGRYASDCAVHSLERWVQARPSPAELARVADLDTGFPDRVGYALGIAQACLGGPACAGSGAVRTSCETTAAQVRRGELPCPQSPAPPGFPRPAQ